MLNKYEEHYTRIQDISYYIYFTIVNLMYYYYMKLLLIYLPNYMFNSPILHIKRINEESSDSDDSQISESDKTEINVDILNYSIFIINALIINKDESEENITNKVRILCSSDGIINIEELKCYFPNIKMFYIVYIDELDEIYKKKSIDITKRFDTHNNVKCSFGKIKF